MRAIPKTELEQLYESGKSMQEIADLLKCSVHKIKYWIDIYGITKRSRSEAMYVKLNPYGDPFKIRLPTNPEDERLFGLGIGIYWGEGNKSDNVSVKITNTDPEMIITFRNFLLKICQVKESKFSYSIICFNDASPAGSIDYWSSRLEIKKEKFGKIVQIPQQGRGSYKHKSQYGVCSICFSNIKLKKWVMSQIGSLDSSTAERAHGKG